MATKPSEKKYDKVVEDSFPASDPPANSGIVGPRGTHRGHAHPAPNKRDEDSRPKGLPNHDRHATETAYQWEDEERPKQR